MSKLRKPKPDDFRPLIAQAIERLNDAITSLNDAKAAAESAKNAHAKGVINRLVTHTMAIAKGARQLTHPGVSPSTDTPQPPLPTAV